MRSKSTDEEDDQEDQLREDNQTELSQLFSEEDEVKIKNKIYSDLIVT